MESWELGAEELGELGELWFISLLRRSWVTSSAIRLESTYC